MHYFRTRLPEGAVVQRRGNLVASPPLLFLQLASELDFHRLVLLGLQMCAHPPGRPFDAITSKEALLSFIERMNVQKAYRLRGRAKALRALKYVENGSNSIMESLVFMMLTLPNAHGGFGLKGACFNHEIPLAPEAARRLGQRRCFVDLYYPVAKWALEYDSFQHHSSPAEQGKDALRASALERRGVGVVHLNTIQLYDAKAFEEFAYNLASRLGKRIRIRAKGFPAAHRALRALLPTKS
ncbi:MAG: hypothetical protein LBR44_04400 [Clostridiales Family XIII bacterium]|nr:hypothetical protein [Clostridiales Family XIII bacterium]